MCCDRQGALRVCACMAQHACVRQDAMHAVHHCVTLRPALLAVTYDDNNDSRQMHLYQEEYRFLPEGNAGAPGDCGVG
jgi:hypothetical protein